MINRSQRAAVLLSSLLLAVSFLGAAATNPDTVYSEEIMLVDRVGFECLPAGISNRVEVLEMYDDHLLVSARSDLVDEIGSAGVSLTDLPERTVLYIGGRRIDITDESSDIPDIHEGGLEGSYIVHMIGPIISRWRSDLEEMGVRVINYIPNHAYRVRMTAELAQEVDELDFVNWVGIYHPDLKLQKGLAAGVVEIHLESMEDVAELRDSIKIRSTAMVGGGYMVTASVQSMDTLYDIAKMDSVYHISRNVEIELHDEIATQHIGGGSYFFDDQDDDPETAYRSHGEYGSYMNQLGYTGSNVVTAVADTGLGDGTVGDAGHPDFTGRVIGGYSYSGGWADGHGHGTHCAGSVGGDTYHGTGDTFYNDYYSSVGSAPDTDFFAVKLFSDAGGYIGPDDIYHVVQVAKQDAGAYVHSNSWGAAVGGIYDQRSQSFDRAVRDADPDLDGNHPMIVTTSAGNSGSNDNTVGAPGTGKNVITVGATDRYPEDPHNVAAFSSRGWTTDNRVKPDVVAPGVGIYSMTPVGGYVSMSGTSMSNPAVAGAAAVVVEWFQVNHGYTPSPAMVRAVLINTANPIDGNTRGHIPNQDEGWGMVDISKLERPFGDPIPFYLFDEDTVFTDSLQTDEHLMMVDREDEPLKITLTWTDKEAPAGTGEGRALVNDLDLEVESPSGDIYRGNAFSGGWTPPNQDTMSDFDYSGDGRDDTNNVENVYIHPDEVETGVYTVRISAANIADDAVNLGYNSQDYALIGYNALADIPGEPPSVTVTSPDGGEEWHAYSQEEITWETAEGDDPIDCIHLSYSTDNGSTWYNIDSGSEDAGVYLWDVPNIHSVETLIRVRVIDTAGRMGEDTSSEPFMVVGVEPEPPDGLTVQHFGQRIEVLFDGIHGGYLTGRSHSQASGWDIRDHCAAEGDDSWDWGDGEFNKDPSHGMLSWLITPEIEIPESADQDHGVLFTFQHWRDFGDNGLYDGGNVKISVDGPDGPWELIEPMEGYDGTVPAPFGNPLGGQRAYGGTSDWVNATFDLNSFIGETVNIRWDAGTEAWDGLEGEGWRIDDIYMEALVDDPDCTRCNLISWDASPSDVSHYNIYRSDDPGGPWDDSTLIDSIEDKGSTSYGYLDSGRGTEDDVRWWYLVRAVGENGLEEDNDAAVQEPLADLELIEIALETANGSDGWNFVSLSLATSDKSLTSILEHPEYGISGSYDRVMYFDAASDRWFSYVPDRPDHFNDLSSWDHTMAVWIRMTDDDVLTIEGEVPSDPSVELLPGWNMVGMPLLNVGEIEIPDEVTTIGYFDPDKDHNIAYTEAEDTFLFEPHEGYFIYNSADHIVELEVEHNG